MNKTPPHVGIVITTQSGPGAPVKTPQGRLRKIKPVRIGLIDDQVVIVKKLITRIRRARQLSPGRSSRKRVITSPNAQQTARRGILNAYVEGVWIGRRQGQLNTANAKL